MAARSFRLGDTRLSIVSFSLSQASHQLSEKLTCQLEHFTSPNFVRIIQTHRQFAQLGHDKGPSDKSLWQIFLFLQSTCQYPTGLQSLLGEHVDEVVKLVLDLEGERGDYRKDPFELSVGLRSHVSQAEDLDDGDRLTLLARQ